MKVIVAGSRTIILYKLVVRAIEESPYEITELVCGMARGVDLLAKRWADNNGIPVKKFPAKWKIYGKKVAGILRNQEMGFYAEALLAIWDGKSTGTSHMIKYMRDKMMKPTKVRRVVTKRKG